MRATFLVFGLLATSAMGQVTPDNWEQFEDWTVLQGPDRCAFAKVVESGEKPTYLTVIRYAIGRTFISLKNEGWSVAQGQRRTLYFYFDTGQFYALQGLGMDDHAIAVEALPEMLGPMATAKYVNVYLKIDDDKEVPLDQIGLSGSAEAIASSGRCLKDLAANQAEAEKAAKRKEWIKPDPFSAQ